MTVCAEVWDRKVVNAQVAALHIPVIASEAMLEVVTPQRRGAAQVEPASGRR